MKNLLPYKINESWRYKIKYLKFAIWTLEILLLTSCTSLSKLGLKDYPNDRLSKHNYHELNGIYSNCHDTILGRLEHAPYDGYSEPEMLNSQDIISQLFFNPPESSYREIDGKIIQPNEKWIKIEFLTKRKAIVSMYHNDRFVFSKIIHGKFRNGYFYLRPKIFIIPLVPIVFGYYFERARIGKSSKNLLIDYTINMWGFAIAAGSSEKGYTSSVYKRKE